MSIEKNIGTTDRLGRIIAGALLLLLVPLALAAPAAGWAWWGLLGVVPLVAGLMGYCPPYALLGINTARRTAGHRRRPGASGAGRCC